MKSFLILKTLTIQELAKKKNADLIIPQHVKIKKHFPFNQSHIHRLWHLTDIFCKNGRRFLP